MKQAFLSLKKIADSCAAMELYMGLDIGHLFCDSERANAPRA